MGVAKQEGEEAGTSSCIGVTLMFYLMEREDHCDAQDFSQSKNDSGKQ